MPSRQWEHELEVVGLKYRLKKDTRKVLADMIERKGQITGIQIVREPDNTYDENAIMVRLPKRLLNGMQIGYLHKETAELLAPKLDGGTLRIVRAELWTLNPRDDFNSGDLRIRFQDVAVKRATKPKR